MSTRLPLKTSSTVASGAVGLHFVTFPWTCTAVELQSAYMAIMAFVGAVGQHFITFTGPRTCAKLPFEVRNRGCVLIMASVGAVGRTSSHSRGPTTRRRLPLRS